MQDRNTLVLLKKVTRAQRDIRRTDRLLTYLSAFGTCFAKTRLLSAIL